MAAITYPVTPREAAAMRALIDKRAVYTATGVCRNPIHQTARAARVALLRA